MASRYSTRVEGSSSRPSQMISHTTTESVSSVPPNRQGFPNRVRNSSKFSLASPAPRKGKTAANVILEKR